VFGGLKISHEFRENKIKKKKVCSLDLCDFLWYHSTTPYSKNRIVTIGLKEQTFQQMTGGYPQPLRLSGGSWDGVAYSLTNTIGGMIIKTPPPKKFFLRPYRISGDFCTGFKKRFGLYYIRVVTLGSVGGEGV
jgi:hypothetical protein